MRAVTCSLAVSIDGFVAGPDGDFDWADPDEELFRFATDEVRGLGVHLLGRRLHEAMLYWQDPPEPLGALEQEFARVWNALPKVVFSSTLTHVDAPARLATGSLAEEVAGLREQDGPGNVGIGGATLAVAAAEADLIDEYRLRVYPVLTGGGTPLFPADGRRRDFTLRQARTFASGVQFLHYVRR
ncbi:dihydrofolate reductase family protein [Kineococcus rhizosphaerae]|uniref:Dihydrofolate reductase n=1 Tax=Kineococcus rhizosphaerae TaxID=559628 RepID=A0A2T0R5V1_9ACTN|nr:dihydrofolate reductase family protein [Kineococcus rhizosphaerae]PRY16107.1 dihydrofolate reductase [Kineococcus rhizosphaerae]